MTAIAAPGRVFANMFAKGTAFVVEKGAQMVMVAIAGRMLGTAGFGRFSFASTLAVVLAFGSDLGLTTWTGLARLLRGETLKLSELEYIQAAHAFGVRHARVITRHLLPNVMHIVLIALVMDFSGLVLAEAVLSYVGVGVDPSTNSFGTMINAARLEMARDPMVWWTLAAAFVLMFVLVLAANLFADAVRDGFDPRVLVGPRMAGAVA